VLPGYQAQSKVLPRDQTEEFGEVPIGDLTQKIGKMCFGNQMRQKGQALVGDQTQEIGKTYVGNQTRQKGRILLGDQAREIGKMYVENQTRQKRRALLEDQTQPDRELSSSTNIGSIKTSLMKIPSVRTPTG
jgi:hypothetical protein